ncbi:unnamed protein product [Caretta caretta]
MGLGCRYFVGLVLLWSLRIALGQGDFHRVSFSVLQHEYNCGDYGMQLLVFPSQGRTVRFKVVDEFGTPFEVTNCSICLHWVTSGEQGAMIFSAGYNGCHVQKKDGRNHLQVRVEELLSARAVAATYDVNMTCPKPTERDLTPEETMRYVPQPGLVRPVPQPQPGLVRPVPQPQPGLGAPGAPAAAGPGCARCPSRSRAWVRPVPQPQPGLGAPGAPAAAGPGCARCPSRSRAWVRPVPQPQPGLGAPGAPAAAGPGCARCPSRSRAWVRPVPQPQPGLGAPGAPAAAGPGCARCPSRSRAWVRPVPQPQPGLGAPGAPAAAGPGRAWVRPVPQPQPGLGAPGAPNISSTKQHRYSFSLMKEIRSHVYEGHFPLIGYGEMVANLLASAPSSIKGDADQEPEFPSDMLSLLSEKGNILHLEDRGAHLTEEQCRVVAGKMPCADAPGQAPCFQAGCCYDETDLTTPCYYGNTVTVQCLLDGHFVLVVSRDMSDHPIILESVRLAYAQAGCDPIRMTEAFVIFRFPLMQCGTTVQVIHDKLIYENQLISGIDIRTGPDGSITRDSTFILHARCIYNASDFLPVQVEVFLPPTPAPVTQAGPLRLELRIATDPSYRSYLTERDYPVVKVLRDPVYMEVRILHRTDPSLVLVLHQCWATPSANPLQQPQWPILVDGCPFLGDNYRTQLVPVGPASSELPFPTHHQRFVLSTFAFVDSASQVALEGEVYIYCSASACYPSRLEPCRTLCPSGAATRGRRFLDINNGTGEPQDLVSSPGPVIFQESPEPWREHVYENKDPVSRLDLTLVLLAMLSLVVVASLVTVTLLHRRSSWMTRSQIFHGR